MAFDSGKTTGSILSASEYEAMLDAVIHADGSVDMTGDLDVSTNDILNVSNVYNTHGSNMTVSAYNSSGQPKSTLTFVAETGQIYAYNDNVIDLGRANGTTTRFKEIFAVTVTEGDHGFAETYCVKCNKDFEVNDTLVFRVIFKTDGRPYSIPIHLECASKPKVKFTRQEAVKETIYIFDEKKGKSIPHIEHKTEKKKYLKKRLKKGYKINQKTGELCDGKKKCTKSQALEVYEEVEDEVVYHDVEYEV